MRRTIAALRDRGLIAAALSMTLVSWSHATSFYEEQNQLIRASRSVSALGPNLFGDKVNLYTGTLEFVQGDLSLPGNNALFVGVSRKLATGPNARLLQGNFGGWDLEIPRLQGVFSQSKGWMSNLGTSFTNQRCSQFAGPGTVKGVNNDGYFNAQEYWRGHMLYDPATGEQEVLTRSPASPPGPTDGNSYPLLTKGHWALRCGVSLDSRNAFYQASSNNQGEGFWAVSPDGVSYRFDWLVRRRADLLQRASVVGDGLALAPGQPAAVSAAPTSGGLTPLAATSYNLGRDEVWILPTLARDRNGNTVTYSYDPAKPWRLMTVSSSDNRSLSFSYDGDSNRVSSVTDGTRTVYYSYLNGELSAVTYADGSHMLLSSGLPLGSTPRFGAPPQCDVAKSGTPQDDVGQLTFTHPSGATGTFTVQSIGHARSYVPNACVGGATPTKPLVFTPYPLYFATRSLVGKSISGPGLPSQSWTYSYSAAANQASWSDCTGSCPATKTVQVVESSGNQSRQTLVFGNRVDVDEGKLLSQSEGSAAAPQMRVTTFAYQTGQLLGYSLQPMGDNTTARRNDPTRLRQIVQSGATFKWEATAFDATWDRPTTVTRSGPGGSVTEVTAYEDRLTPYVIGQVGTVTATSVAGQPVIVRHQYDGLGRLTSSASFGVTQFTQDYYGDGTLAWRADGAGRRTNYSSYWRGLPQNIGYPDGASETAAVNNLGLVTSLTNAAGYTTGYGYDAAGRLASITPPSGWTPTYLTFERVSSPEYGIPANHWRQTISQGNARTVSYFDGFWRPLMTRIFDTTLEASTRKVVVKGYDASGQLGFESYPQRDAGSVGITSPGKRMSYDALGRLLRTDADSELGVITSSQLYLDGFQIQFTNPRGKISTQSHWALDKPEDALLGSLSLPEGVTVSIGRDAFGKPMAISRGGVTRRYVYDAGQRLCKTVEPEINATIQDYDAAGNVAWRAPGQTLTGTNGCDTAAVAGTTKISYGYDAMNRLSSTSYGDGSPGITRTYWPDGMLKTVDSNGSSWSYGYNSLRLLNTETLSYSGQSFPFIWDYNPNGHLGSLTYPGGMALAYVPNALGEPSRIGSYATGLSFHPNGSVNSFAYGNGKLHTLTPNLRGLPATNEDAGVLKDVYTYDANGNVLSIADQQGSGASFNRSMVYDDLDRLKTVSAPSVWGTASYTYDAADNLKTANVGSRNVTLNYVDGTNRLNSLSVNGSTSNYSYDPYGNIRSKGAQSYTFDLGNRLTVAAGNSSYVYDGLGRRIKVVSSDLSTRLSVYSLGGQLLWSTSTGGSRPASTTAYVYLGGRSIAEINSVSGTQYVHTDALGSPVTHTDASGTALNTTRFEPYGYVAAGTKPGPATSLIGFTGHVQDPETELVYMQQRYYDPIAGRFLSVDPIVTDANTGKGFGLYTYVDNNPYSNVDPDGRQAAPNVFPNFDPTQYLKDLAVESAKFIGVASGGAGGTAIKSVEVGGALLKGAEVANVAEKGVSAAGKAAEGTVTVGRWMSEAEHKIMTTTGKVVESTTGTTHVALPANAETFIKQAAAGSRYIQFGVPASSVKMTGGGFAKIIGPSSLDGRLAAMKGAPIKEMPSASDISWIATKVY